MKTLLLPALALLLTALPTFARLGESKAECEARYGKPVFTTVRNGNSIYLKGGHQITIGFWKDKAIFLVFTKLEPGTKESDLPVESTDSLPFSETEMDLLLQANSGTFKWRQQRDNKDKEADIAWDLSDGKGYAEYADQCLEVRNQPALEEWINDRNIRRAAAIPHLGESRAELEKRCGKPVKTYDSDRVGYQKGSFIIDATFWNDKAARLRFESAVREKDPFSENPDKTNPSPLYGEEIKALLAASAGNSKWEESQEEENYWDRADKKAYAVYHPSEWYLTIVDEEYSEYEAATEEKEATAKFKDFGGLGKTRAECEKLYGKPLISPANGPTTWHKHGIAIIATFWKDKAAQFDFVKIDAKAPDIDEANRKSFYLAEHSALLKSFGGGSEWKESEDPDEDRITWLRADHEVIALYKSDEKIFTIYAYDYFHHLTKEVDDEETKALDGF
jgi:hypothetical protein